MKDDYEIIGYIILEIEEIIDCLMLEGDYDSYIIIPL